MNFSIKNKLFLITILPSVTLVLLASIIAYNDYKIFKSNDKFLKQVTYMDEASELMYNFQQERGLSIVDYKEYENDFFLKELNTQRMKTNDVLDIFISKKREGISHLSQDFLNTVEKNREHLLTVRKQIDKGIVSREDGYLFYTNLDNTLLEFANSISLYSNDEVVATYLLALQKILKLQELLGQERGLLTRLLSQDDITEKDRYILRTNTKLQRKESKYIKIILEKTAYKQELISIEREHVSLRLNYLLLTPEQWFVKSTQKIDQIHSLYKKIFTEVGYLLGKRQEELKNHLVVEVFGTVFVILILLIANLYVSSRITKSIKKLGNGLGLFFEFLQFKRELPQPIETDSHDEIYVMAKEINEQMLSLNEDLNDDVDFINEVTQIVYLMKEGDFSERPYFEPKNPNLLELKEVFNELVTLIADKIKEQTDSLERLNSSLEDKVYLQTIELQNQVQTVTKARDEAIKAQVAKDEFLANMSHEIRTPLNGILGFVTILKKMIKEEKAQNYLSIIDASGKSLLAIINDILDFSKIQSGQFVIDKHPTNAVEEFSNTTMLFASKAYEKNLIYVVYIDPNMPSSLNIDVTRIKQILSNLLSNAIKFTGDNGTIKVSIIYKDFHLNISVGDSGIGISPQNQSKIFSAFTQADGSTTRNYGGTGLGLSISASLAELMDGELSLESKLGKGSIFTLRVPVEVLENKPTELIDKESLKDVKVALLTNCIECSSHLRLIHKYLDDFGVANIRDLEEYSSEGYDILFFAPDEEYNTQVLEAGIPAIAILRSEVLKLAKIKHIQSLYAPFVPKAIANALIETGVGNDTNDALILESDDEEIEYMGSILIAEDNKTNQMLVKLLMMDYGIDFTIANDGIEAVDAFKNAKFDMVLMDENMPNLNGIEATHQIKEYEKENNLDMTPIVALTASALDTDRERFLNEGMDGFVAKPIDNKLLEKELDKYLQRV